MQRNFIAFILVSAAILSGWFYFVDPMNQKRDDKKLVQVDDTKKPPDVKKAPPKKGDAEDKKKIEEKNPVVAKEEKEEPDRTVVLGEKGAFLTVALSARGAAVRRVTLNQFERADWRGQPTNDKLELIQDDPFAPSYRMYHYERHDAENPVFGLGEKNWAFDGNTVLEDKTEEARFSTTLPGNSSVKITKVYRLAPRDYHVTLQLKFEHEKKADEKQHAVSLRYQLTGAQGLPVEGEWYATTFRNAYVAMVDHNERAYRDVEESMRISQRRGGDTTPRNKFDRGSVRVQYAVTANQYFGAGIVVDNKQPRDLPGAVAQDKILAWARPTLETKELSGVIHDLGANHIVMRDRGGKEISFRLLPRTKRHIDDLGLEKNRKAVLSFYVSPRAENIATWIRAGESLRPQFDDITVRVNSEVVELDPGDRAVHQFLLYHGPVKAALLGQFTGEKAVEPELIERYTRTLHLRTLTDYPADNWVSREVFSRIMLTDLIILVTRFMHWVLNFLQPVFGYGLSIVVLTVLVRGAMFPISRKQALFSMKMQQLAPELKKIQDKYPDDPHARMQATQEFYRKHGINPLGSCWPVFLQMPIFLGLYFAFQESIHFRNADFLWIESLSAPDMTIEWGDAIPYISAPDSLGSMFYLGPFLNILPICAVVLMMVQQMQTMPPPTNEQEAMQQKMLKFMSIFFGLMFYKVAAGLCIYFVASSLWGMAERKLLPKKKPETMTAAPASVSGKNATTSNKWNKAPKKEREDDSTALGKLKAWWKDVLKQAEKK